MVQLNNISDIPSLYQVVSLNGESDFYSKINYKKIRHNIFTWKSWQTQKRVWPLLSKWKDTLRERKDVKSQLLKYHNESIDVRVFIKKVLFSIMFVHENARFSFLSIQKHQILLV